MVFRATSFTLSILPAWEGETMTEELRWVEMCSTASQLQVESAGQRLDMPNLPHIGECCMRQGMPLCRMQLRSSSRGSDGMGLGSAGSGGTKLGS